MANQDFTDPDPTPSQIKTFQHDPTSKTFYCYSFGIYITQVRGLGWNLPSSRCRRSLELQDGGDHKPKPRSFLGNGPLYLAEYQFWAHLASTARSTRRIFLPSKGFSMQSTTIALATSDDSVGPSKMTSS